MIVEVKIILVDTVRGETVADMVDNTKMEKVGLVNVLIRNTNYQIDAL